MPLELVYDKLVIGSPLEAVLFSFYNKIPLIYTRNLQPSRFDTVEDYGLGTSCRDIWNEHMFQLSLACYNPFENKVKHIRYDTENTIKVITHTEGVYTIKYNILYVFDDHDFLDLPLTIKKTSDEIRILDWFMAKKGKSHELDSIEQNSKFMKQIIFYEYNRHKTKNICVVSYIDSKELEKYPEHLVKIKTESLMKLKGVNNQNVELDHIQRDIQELGKNIYEDFDNVQFVYTDQKIMYDFHYRRAKIDYMKYLRLKLGI